MSEVLEELRWRGLIAQHTDIDELEKALNDGPITFYCGFDPTAPSLHHGHLVAVKVIDTVLIITASEKRARSLVKELLDLSTGRKPVQEFER